MHLRRFFSMLLIPMLLSGSIGCKWIKAREASKIAEAGPGLWEVSYGENKSYLFGSIHVGRDDFYPLPPAVEEAFKNSKTFLIEANLASMSPLHLNTFIECNGIYPENDRLKNHLSKETAELLKGYREENKMSWALLDRWKPWVVNCIIAGIEVKKAGFVVEKGIDQHFLKEAAFIGKPVVELETCRSQLEISVRLDPDLQELMLLQSLKQMGGFKAEMEELIAVWKSGDLERMNRAFIVEGRIEEPRLQAYSARFLDRRNAQMVTIIDSRIRSKDSAFILVGSAHLPGDQGILKLLENKGFTIRQVLPTTH